MTAEEVRDLLRARMGTDQQKVFADKIGVSQSFLSDVLARRREPSGPVLDYLGLHRVVTYRPKPKR